MKVNTGNVFRVTDSVIGDWVEIPSPLTGERLLQYVGDRKDHMHIETPKNEHIRNLSRRVYFKTINYLSLRNTSIPRKTT